MSSERSFAGATIVSDKRNIVRPLVQPQQDAVYLCRLRDGSALSIIST